jgi:catechol 2,3-dioxygenase-like lactoylglutathione lyase family enzyme
MLDSSDVIAFVAAADLERARAFYEEVLGGTVLRRDRRTRHCPAWIYRSRLAGR